MGDRGWGTRAPTPAEIAWIALIPCALATLAAMLVLGSPLGHLLFRPDPDGLWPPGWPESAGRPEPVKLGRYVLAAAAPLALAASVLVLARRRAPRLRPPLIRALALAGQALLLAFVALAVLGQHELVLVDRPLPHLFGVGTLLVAAGIVLAALLALRRREVAAAVARLARETRARRAAGLVIAAVVAVLWLLEGLLVDGIAEDHGVMAWTVDDAFAVLDGRTPLVDYRLLYAKLLPYPAALAMAVFGTTAFVYTLAMTLLSVLALLGVYAIFRRIVGGSLLALALFVPFTALSDVEHTMQLTAMWPMRYGGAFLMAWLAARHVDGDRPRRVWPLFAIGAVVAVNELEFGAAALVATLVAIACARPPRAPRAALRLLGEAAGGLLLGLAAIALATLARAGALPDPALLMEWPHIFTRLGWFSLATPIASLHLALYATFAGAVVLAAVRLARGGGEDDRLLTSMLAWSGVFGLAAASYYVGRSDDLKLVSMFSAWAFSLALLTVVAVRALAARGWRRPTLAQLLVLFGFALAICSIVRLTPPQRQISDLANAQPGGYRPVAEGFVGALTRRGQKVVALMPMGHRIAYDLGLDNVSPYPTQDALVTREQLQHVIDAARREDAHAIFLLTRLTAPEQLTMLEGAGFGVTAQTDQFVELRDRPAAAERRRGRASARR